MALNLMKTFRGAWETDRGLLQQDLESVQVAFNQATVSRPHLIAFNSVAQTIPDNVWTQLHFDSTVGVDPQATAILQSRGILTVPIVGKYWLDARATFVGTGGAVASRGIKVTIGSDVIGGGFITNDESGTGATVASTNILTLNANDTITAWVYQNSGISVDVGFITDRAFQTRITLSLL